MTLRIYQVDAFTDKPFAGNPAGVCILEAPADERWMQNVAAEMNVAETAFLVREQPGQWSLRWFTPAVEVDLCGHATLASAHTIWETGADNSPELTFSTRSGQLRANREETRIALDFPEEMPQQLDDAALRERFASLDPQWIGRNRMDLFIEAKSAAAVRDYVPDAAAIRSIDARGVIVTARAHDKQHHFISRFFAPAVGIEEDPVTGSAHCALAPYWGARLGLQEMAGYQASARGGEVGVRLERGRVILLGQAVTVLRADLLA